MNKHTAMLIFSLSETMDSDTEKAKGYLRRLNETIAEDMWLKNFDEVTKVKRLLFDEFTGMDQDKDNPLYHELCGLMNLLQSFSVHARRRKTAKQLEEGEKKLLAVLGERKEMEMRKLVSCFPDRISADHAIRSLDRKRALYDYRVGGLHFVSLNSEGRKLREEWLNQPNQ